MGFKSGSQHPLWKKSGVSYKGLHQWMRRNLLKPDLCQICIIKPPYDVACVTGVYNRDFINWRWLCRRCHLRSDNRIKLNLKQGHELGTELKDMSDRICSICGSNKTYIDKRRGHSGRPQWSFINNKLACGKCAHRIRHQLR